MESIDTFSGDVINSLMSQVSFLQSFSDDEKTFVMQYMDSFLRFKPDEVILKEGEVDSREMYILLSGQVKVTSGREGIILSDVMVGELFGEISFYIDTPRTATVIAEEACIVWRVDHKLLDTAPIALREKIKDKILFKLAKVISRSNQQLLQKLT